MATVSPSEDTVSTVSSRVAFHTDVNLVTPSRNEILVLKTCESGIAFESTGNQQMVLWISFSDIVGVKTVKIYETKGFIELQYTALCIISYPVYTGIFRGKYRSRTETIVKTPVSSEVSDKTDEKEIIISWKESILNIFHKYLLENYQYFDVDSSVEVVEPFKDRSLLVVMNPVSGQGTCPRVYKEEVSQIFEDAGIKQDVIQTEYKGHASDIIKNYDLTSVQGIVCMGGDGTVHEVVNGLMNRPDWRSAIKMPICPIPCGSGNALAKTVLEESGEEYSTINAALLAVYGAYVPYDIAIAENENEKLYFFMSFSWGMIADSDIESEKFRFLGEIRFTLAGFKCCLINKVYSGTLQYLPHREYQVQAMEEPIVLESLRDMMPPEESIKMKPMIGAICPQQQLPITLPDNTKASQEFNSEPPRASLLEPFEQELSGDWVTLDSTLFTMFNPTLLPNLTRSMKIAPDHIMGGGYITLVMALGVKPRLGILKAIRNWEKGLHTPEIDIIKAEAFRFKPQDRDGVYSIDGEMFPVQNFQAQILKQLGRIMCKKRKEHTSALTPQSGSVIS